MFFPFMASAGAPGRPGADSAPQGPDEPPQGILFPGSDGFEGEVTDT
jgi:hypothetical protein